MAAHVSIDEYLAALDRRWRGRPDRDELLDEVEDHLRTTAEAAIARGVAASVAEATTVERFGDASAIADALAEANGAPALPTPFTRTGGLAALTAGGAWVLFGLLWLSASALDDGDWNGPPMFAFMAAMAALVAAATCGVVVVLALDRRHGGLGWSGRVATVAAAIAVPAALLSWFVAGWGTLISVAWLTVGIRLLRDGVAPKGAVLMSASAWPVGLGTFATLRAMEFGTVDSWGDYPAATLVGVLVGSTLMAIGMTTYGRWLRSEEPVTLAGEHVAA